MPRQWQGYGEGGSPQGLARHADGTAVRFDHRLDQAEPEAEAAIGAARIAAKQPVPYSGTLSGIPSGIAERRMSRSRRAGLDLVSPPPSCVHPLSSIGTHLLDPHRSPMDHEIGGVRRRADPFRPRLARYKSMARATTSAPGRGLAPQGSPRFRL